MLALDESVFGYWEYIKTVVRESMAANVIVSASVSKKDMMASYFIYFVFVFVFVIWKKSCLISIIIYSIFGQ